MVGRLERKRLSFRIGYLPGLRAWARCLTFVYGAIHGNNSQENTELLVREVISSLRGGEAEVAMLEFVPIDSTLYQAGLTAPSVLSRDTLPAPQGHESLTIPDSIDVVYRLMSRDRRKHTKASVKKLQLNQIGEPRLMCYRATAELDRIFHDAEEIARKTYQRGLGAGFIDNPIVRARLALGAQKGWLRAYLLYLGDRPCAFWIGMLYHGTFVSEYMGYDPEFRQYSPGMVLIMRVIEGFCNRKDGDTVKELDFGLGHAEYKEALCSRNWLEAVVYIFSPTPKGLLLKLMRTTTRLLDVVIRKALGSTKTLPRLKRAWRDRLAGGGKTPSGVTGKKGSAGPWPAVRPN